VKTRTGSPSLLACSCIVEDVDVDPDPHHPWSVADAGTASITRDTAPATTREAADLTIRFPADHDSVSSVYYGTPRFTLFI